MEISASKIVAVLNNSEGRDKLMKLHQYQGRMWKHLLQNSNPELADKADIIFSSLI